MLIGTITPMTEHAIHAHRLLARGAVCFLICVLTRQARPPEKALLDHRQRPHADYQSFFISPRANSASFPMLIRTLFHPGRLHSGKYP